MAAAYPRRRYCGVDPAEGGGPHPRHERRLHAEPVLSRPSDATRGRDYAAFRGYVHERAEHFFQLRKANSLETVPLTLALFSLAGGDPERCVTYRGELRSRHRHHGGHGRERSPALSEAWTAIRQDWLEKVKRNADQDQEELARGLASAAISKMERERTAAAALSALLN